MKNKPSFLRLFERAFAFSLQNIWRNKLLSLATVFVIAIILFIFNVILTINIIAQDSIEDLSKKIDIVLYLKESTDFSEIQQIKTQLEEIEGVTEVSYTSKDAALSDIKENHPDLSIAFEKYNLGNPLPSSLNITTEHPRFHQDIAQYISGSNFKDALSNISANEGQNNEILTSVSRNLIQVSNFTEQLIFWLIITFIIGGAMIILNALQITIFNRRKEINVMQLVGASYWFIRMPFVLEGIIYGIASVLLSIGMLSAVSQSINISNLSLASVNLTAIILIELAITITLCVASSVIAVHEHLHKEID